MAQELANLDAFKAQRDPSTAELPADDSLAGGIGTAYAIISYKGKTWSLRYRGETHLFKDKTGQLMPTIDVVILHAAPGKSKSYFPNWEDGSPIHRCARRSMALCRIWTSSRYRRKLVPYARATN